MDRLGSLQPLQSSIYKHLLSLGDIWWAEVRTLQRLYLKGLAY